MARGALLCGWCDRWPQPAEDALDDDARLLYGSRHTVVGCNHPRNAQADTEDGRERRCGRIRHSALRYDTPLGQYAQDCGLRISTDDYAGYGVRFRTLHRFHNDVGRDDGGSTWSTRRSDYGGAGSAGLDVGLYGRRPGADDFALCGYG